MSQPYRVLLILPDVDLRDRCAAQLAREHFQTWFRLEEIPGNGGVDVVVAQPETADQARAAFGQPGEPIPTQLVLGEDATADAWLPADVEAGQLRQVCRLLGEIARLRRAQHQSAAAAVELHRLAITDPLTQLPNRRAWDAEIARRLPLASPDRPQCLALIDLDEFKQINDQFGFLTGDEILRAVGQRIGQAAGRNKFVARLGGDEFGVLCSVRSPTDAHSVVDRVRQSITGTPLPEEITNVPPLTASAGLVVVDRPSDDPRQLLQQADRARRRAKRRGGNRVEDEG